uniref:Major facilitator superfamily associated domain-containing protein n=1 Tax=Bartheletia paradoxa TaxID=669517 RepID=A0A2D0XI54_9BASI|nr:hypothetical protein SPAR01527 [Bartheletia paradoxa]
MSAGTHRSSRKKNKAVKAAQSSSVSSSPSPSSSPARNSTVTKASTSTIELDRVGSSTGMVHNRSMRSIDEKELAESGFTLDQARDRAVESKDEETVKRPLSQKDKNAMVLLVVLYLLQGIPVGLAFGAIPYLLKSRLSYSQLALFSLSTYPYSLKLLWSPIVDACFWPKLGRRKSWIVPIQIVVGLMMWWLGKHADDLINASEPDVHTLTAIFFALVFFAATQDIAVDGWALTLLSKDNLSYASTAQTIGLNTGYFLSFTVFLAFNSVEFSNKYFRSTSLDYPLLSLGGYLQFWAVAFFAVTGWLTFMQKEDPVSADDPEMDLKKVYSVMISICKLKHVQSFILVHLLAKIGFQANDAVTGLKLIEKGFSKEDMALAVLIDFPCQIVFGYLAARWSKGDRPLRPWLNAFWMRLGFALVAMGIVHIFPAPPISSGFFGLVICTMVLSSFASTVQFVCIAAFHNRIADPLIGGSYMTLLNTVSNLGGTWPRFFVLQSVDLLSRATCVVEEASSTILVKAPECVSEHGKASCIELGGNCVTDRDGYYLTSIACVVVGSALLLFYIAPTARRLQVLPASAWRVKLIR